MVSRLYPILLASGVFLSSFAVANDAYRHDPCAKGWTNAAYSQNYGLPLEGASTLPGNPYYESLEGYWRRHEGALPDGHPAASIANIILPEVETLISIAFSEIGASNTAGDGLQVMMNMIEGSGLMRILNEAEGDERIAVMDKTADMLEDHLPKELMKEINGRQPGC